MHTLPLLQSILPVLGGALLVVAQSLALTSHTVSFPIKAGSNSGIEGRLASAFEDMVDSTEFIQEVFSATASTPAVYGIPLFGSDCRLTFGSAQQLTGNESPQKTTTSPTEFVLKAEGVSKEDFGWLCRKLYDSRETFGDDIDMTNLRNTVFSHVNSQPPHPGYDASAAALAGSNVISELFASSADYMSEDEILSELSREGFVVLEAGIKTSEQSNRLLSEFLLHKTGQETRIRTDTVAFLDRDDAESCGLENHYDFLMGIASYLNKNHDFEPSCYQPIFPGTATKPLTNPNTIQAAEYGQGDFYVAHSDNSWAQNQSNDEGQPEWVRSNFRAFTAILYCNDDWESPDGGSLRIFKDSTLFARAKDAPPSCEFYDVVPKNGRLVIFDSRLVHSVEQVMAPKSRRALTIWIHRPSDEKVRGEVIEVPP